MARLPRLSIPGYPHHVIQRGNNRQAIFALADDYQFMLELLEEAARKHAVAVHAYVLMANHFHLLATPSTDKALPQMMQAVGRRYVRRFNQAQARSGTLWEGRYRATIIQPERYLLPCMAYIDLNPVRSGLVVQARDYPWSSHAFYIGLRQDRLITPHPLYWELGNTPFAREVAYAEVIDSGVSTNIQDDLTQAAQLGWALGDEAFLAGLQKKTSRRLSRAKAGRPARVKTEA